jgi:hypothetical protein
MARLVAQTAGATTAQHATTTQHAKSHHGTCLHIHSTSITVYAVCIEQQAQLEGCLFVHAGATTPQSTSSTCTFGNGRELGTADSVQRSRIPQSSNANNAAWSQRERAKLNELYCELGRPHSSRGASSVQEHLRLYSIRHRMTYPERSAAEIVARVAHMIKYNQVSNCCTFNCMCESVMQLASNTNRISSCVAIVYTVHKGCYLFVK